MTAVADAFEYTATGVLGDKRDTMLQNQLLLRNELARPARRGYGSYPGDGFRYGRPMNIKEGGASAALRGWSGNPLPFPSSKELGITGTTDGSSAGRDFVALNKAAVQAGLTSAPENYIFRATHDVRRKPKTADSTKRGASRRLPPTMVFGISTRPSTPVHDLLENRYQDQWIKERRSAESNRRSKEETKRLIPGKVYETRASLLRVHQVSVDPAPLWKMPKFSKHAKPHLQTFRTEQAKSAALKQHQSDCIGRQGDFGQGIYESAKY